MKLARLLSVMVALFALGIGFLTAGNGSRTEDSDVKSSVQKVANAIEKGDMAEAKKQVEEIAKDKMPDLNCFTLESAMKMVAGTARSMGFTVEGTAPWA